MKKILVICAHPDDESLGLGGTLAKHTSNGDKVRIIIMADGESARNDTKNIQKRQEQARKACSILGAEEPLFFNYADQKLDALPVIELTKKIEHVATNYNPEIVYTHFWGDLNQDHRRVCEATMIAFRPKPGSTTRCIICYETPSSTELGTKFEPNMFVDIGSTLKTKLRAFNQYVGEVEKFPHPRSKEALIHRSNFWGSSVGLKYAEAFVIVRNIVRKTEDL